MLSFKPIPAAKYWRLPFVFAFMKVTGTHGELISVPVFQSNGVHDLLHLFLKASGSIVKRLNPAQGQGSRCFDIRLLLPGWWSPLHQWYQA